MTKISFREVVTMKTAEPIFTESALERQRATPKEPYHRERRTPGRDAALVPSGADNLTSLAPSMQQEMHHQGRSIDQISSSVNHLQDTMTDLKLSFNALRIELNGPTHHMGDSRIVNEPGIDMIATVLKELKSKSEEIEKLKLEIEALKFKNRFMEDRKPGSPENLSVMDGAVPVRSPESVQAGRKRAWPDAFPSGNIHPVPDSFGGEDDEEDDLSINDFPSRADTFLIKDAPRPSHAAQQRARSITPNPQTDPNLEDRSLHTDRDLHPDQSPAKRLRLGNGSTLSEPRISEKRRPGRPRKSVSHPPNAQNLPRPNTASAPAVETPNENGVSRKSKFGQSQEASKEDMRTRRRSRSRRSFPAESKVGSDTNDMNGHLGRDNARFKNGHDQNNNGEKQTTNGNSNSLDDKDSHTTETEEDMRKAKIAARDTMTRIAMQHEEAMEAD